MEKKGQFMRLFKFLLRLGLFTYDINFQAMDIEMSYNGLLGRPDRKVVKQKLRHLRPNVLLKVKEEVKKLLDVGFIILVKIPSMGS